MVFGRAGKAPSAPEAAMFQGMHLAVLSAVLAGGLDWRMRCQSGWSGRRQARGRVRGVHEGA